ncbi:MAG TPA: hypothetical protein VGJ02_00165 [Pyrinomonadaceae bacterium]|jgi:hypothetical protein
MTSANAATFEKLRSAVLEIIGQKGNSVTGRIPIEKLADLTDIPEVKLILPMIDY